MELIILVKILALIFLTLNIQESTIDLLDYQISKFDMCWNPLMQDFSYYIVKNNITEVEAQVYLDLSDNKRILSSNLEFFESLKNLKELNLQGTNVTAFGAGKLNEFLPKTNIQI